MVWLSGAESVTLKILIGPSCRLRDHDSDETKACYAECCVSIIVCQDCPRFGMSRTKKRQAAVIPSATGSWELTAVLLAWSLSGGLALRSTNKICSHERWKIGWLQAGSPLRLLVTSEGILAWGANGCNWSAANPNEVLFGCESQW